MNQVTRWPLMAAVILMLTACVNESTEQVVAETTDEPSQVKPNVVIFYLDDLGYGDLGSYGAVGVETPAVDRFAAEGIRFTAAHSAAATCTPARSSLLTGEQGVRSQAAILPGDAPALIRPGKATLASMFKEAG